MDKTPRLFFFPGEDAVGWGKSMTASSFGGGAKGSLKKREWGLPYVGSIESFIQKENLKNRQGYHGMPRNDIRT